MLIEIYTRTSIDKHDNIQHLSKTEGAYQQANLESIINHIEENGYVVSHEIIDLPSEGKLKYIEHKITLTKK